MIPVAIAVARAHEYLTHMEYDCAKRRHMRSAKLFKAWRNSKAALVAIEGRYSRE